MSEKAVAPFGSWSSPFGADAATTFGVRIGEVVVDGDVVWFSLPVPQEQGRVAVFAVVDGQAVEKSPPGANVRSRVHEYGGGAWWVQHGELWWVEAKDQQLRRLDTNDPDAEVVVLTKASSPEASHRYADGRPTPDGRWFICVREVHDGDDASSVRNELVAIAGDGSGLVKVVASGADFYASPRVSSTGDRLAWIQWDHPAMPWDRTELWMAHLADGTTTNDRCVMNSNDADPVAPQQPTWGPDGSLFVVADIDDWWNLYRFNSPEPQATGNDGASTVPVAVGPFEIGVPAWVFNQSRLAVTDTTVYYAATANGTDRLVAIGPDGTSQTIDDYWAITNVRSTADGSVVFVATSAAMSPAIMRWKPGIAPVAVWESPALPFDKGFLPAPELFTFPTTDGAQAHAFWYPPTNPSFSGPDDERPPLVVRAHGGPTGDSPRDPRIDLRYWTSRGVGVVDVMYRGSVGYGRQYREALLGRWGIVDVDDCVAAADFLAQRGDVDGDRMAIAGSSAGGFTVLAALQRGERFSAGAIRYGVTDLKALNDETHKFEARYCDSLIAPWPQDRAVYDERSPINHLDRVTCPVLIQQGGEDKVVPPSQAEALRQGLDERGIGWAYVLYPDEGHGFRSADAIISATETEFAFFAAIWGVAPADDVAAPTIHNYTP